MPARNKNTASNGKANLFKESKLEARERTPSNIILAENMQGKNHNIGSVPALINAS